MDFIQFLSETFPTADKQYADELAREELREEMVGSFEECAEQMLGSADWIDIVQICERTKTFSIDFKSPDGQRLALCEDTPEALCQAIIDSGFFAAELER